MGKQKLPIPPRKGQLSGLPRPPQKADTGLASTLDQEPTLLDGSVDISTSLERPEFGLEPQLQQAPPKIQPTEDFDIDWIKSNQGAYKQYFNEAWDSGLFTEKEISEAFGDGDLGMIQQRLAESKTPSIESRFGDEVPEELEGQLYTQLQPQYQQELEINLGQEKSVISNTLRENVLAQIPESVKADPEKLAEVEQMMKEANMTVDLTGEGKIGNIGKIESGLRALGKGTEDLFWTMTWGIAQPWTKLLVEEKRKESQQEWNKKINQYEQSFSQSLKEGDFDNAFGQVLNTLGESTPDMALAAATGGAGRFVPLATMSFTSGTQEFLNVKDEGWFQDMSSAEKVGYISVKGVSEGVGEWLGGRVFSRAGRGLLRAATKESSEKGIKEFMRGAVKAYGLNVRDEGLGEMITEAGSILADSAIKGEKITVDQITDRLINSGLMGGAVGGMITTAGKVGEASMFLAHKSDFVKELTEKLTKLREEAQQADTPEQKESIQELYTETYLQKSEEIRRLHDLYSNKMSKEDLIKSVNINKEITDLETKAKQLESSPEAHSAIQEKISNLHNQKQKIENNYAVQQQEKKTDEEQIKKGDVEKQAKKEDVDDVKKQKEQEQILEEKVPETKIEEVSKKAEEKIGAEITPSKEKIVKPAPAKEVSKEPLEKPEVPKPPKTIPDAANELKEVDPFEEGKKIGKAEAKAEEKTRKAEVKEQSDITRSRTSILKKDKKRGKFTNVAKDIVNLARLPINKLTDKSLRDEAATVLKDLDNNNVAKYDAKKVQDLTDRVTKSLEKEQQKEVKPLNEKDLSGKILKTEESVQTFGEEAELDIDKATSKDAQRQLRSGLSSILRNIENRRRQINNSLISEEITSEQFDAHHKKLDGITESLNKKISELDKGFDSHVKSLHKKGKDDTRNIKGVSWMSKEQKDFFEEYKKAVKETKEADLTLAEDINNIAFDINNGYIPMTEMEVVMQRASVAKSKAPISTITNKLKIGAERFEKANFVVKKLLGNFSRVGSIKKLNDMVTKLRSQDWAFHDNLFGTKREGIIFSTLEGVIRGESEVMDALSAVGDGLSSILKVNFSDLKKGKEFIDKQFRNNAMLDRVGMIMVERRYRNKYEDGFWQGTLSKEESGRRVSDKKLKEAKSAFDSLPKDKDGNIDIEKAINSLSPTEKKLLGYAESTLDEMRGKEEVSAGKRGTKFEIEEFYFPFLDLARKGEKSEELPETQQMLNPKISSDRAKQQRSKEKRMLEFNLSKVLFNAGKNTYRDFHMASEYKKAMGFFKEMAKSDDLDTRLWGDALAKDLESSFQNTFNSRTNPIVNFLTNSAYSYLLTTIYRLPTEASVEIFRTALTGTSPLSAESIKAIGGQVESSRKAALKNFANWIQGRSKQTPTEVSNLKSLLEFTKSPFRHHFARQVTEKAAPGQIFKRGKGGIGEQAVQTITSAPNKYTIALEWIPSFAKAFKDEAGKSFDFDKSTNKDYLESNKESIFKAAAKADRSTSEIKGVPSRIAQRTLVQFAPEMFAIFSRSKEKSTVYFDALKNPNAAKLNSFMTNFMNREWLKFNSDLADIVTEDNQSKASATRNATAQFASGVMYNMVGITSFAFFMYLLSDSGEEEDRYTKMIEDTWTWKGLYKNVMANTIGMSAGRYGQVIKNATLVVAGGYRAQLKEQKKAATSRGEKDDIQKEIDLLENQTRAMFFSSPIWMSRWQTSKGESAMDWLKAGAPQTAPQQKALFELMPEIVAGMQDENATKEEREALMILYARLVVLLNAKKIPFSKNIDKFLTADKKKKKRTIKARKERKKKK